MGIFDWLKTKASSVGGMRIGFMQNQPVYRSMAGERREQFAKETMRSVFAYRAIRSVATAFGSVELKVMRRKEDGTYEEAENPLLKQLIDRPNPHFSGVQFREGWCSFYSIHGEGPIERVLGTSLGQQFGELYLMEPDRTSPVYDAVGDLVALEYAGKNGRKKRIPTSNFGREPEARYIRSPNPVDPLRGYAPTQAAAASIDTDNAGREWNASLLQNAAAPSGILALDAETTEDQRERILYALESRHSTPSNRGKPLVLGGNMTWTETSHTPKEMDWIEGNRETARQIALAFGIPPMLLGIPGDNTYSNYREARLAFYDDTIIPLLKLFCEELSFWMAPIVGSEFCVKPHLKGIDALDYRAERKYTALSTAGYMSIDEKRREIGLPEIGPEAGGDLIPDVEQMYQGIGLASEEENNGANSAQSS